MAPIALNGRGYHPYTPSINSPEEAVLLPKLSLNLDREFQQHSENQKIPFRDVPSLETNLFAHQDADPANPCSPASQYSLNSFIQENYVMPRSPGGVTTGEVDLKDSGSDFDSDSSVRSVSPSICATAIRVKVTPLRAVIRSIRRSFMWTSNLDTIYFPPSEQQKAARTPCKNVFNIFHRKIRMDLDRFGKQSDVPGMNIPIWADVDAISPASHMFSPFHRTTNDTTNDEKATAATSLGHTNYLSVLHRNASKIRRSASFLGSNSPAYITDVDAELDMTEIHDVTREAPRWR